MTRITTLLDDLWLAKLLVLIRAAREPVSEESILALVGGRQSLGLTASMIRTSLSSLIRRGIIRPTNGPNPAFVVTRRGQKVASEARERLSRLLAVLDNESQG